jgi:hypothetical protein
MMANSATTQSPLRRGAAASSCMIPSAIAARRDFFRSLSTATLKFRVFPIFSAERFAILGTESLALRISAFLAGAERMVPIATRKRFMGGEDVQPTR